MIETNGLPLHSRFYSPVQIGKTEARLTGRFDVTVTTVTPLFVRGMLAADKVRAQTVAGNQKLETPEFFAVDEVPRIPGSSLRGMLRALVEIVTFSKIHFVSDQQLMYRALFGSASVVTDYRNRVSPSIPATQRPHFVYPSQNLRGGYLVRTKSESGWGIQPAQVHNGETFVLVPLSLIRRNLSVDIDPKAPPFPTASVWVSPAARSTYTGQRVNLEVAEASLVSATQKPNTVAATLVLSKTVGRRHWYPAVFEAHKSAPPIPVSSKLWDTFCEDRDMTRGIPTRKVEHEGDVLFYLLDGSGQLVFLGPSMFFRLPYRRTTHELINRAVKDLGLIDYADSMFGYVLEDVTGDGSAYAGRISVTSGKLIGDPAAALEREPFTPKILGSPKPTTFQHYLEQADGVRTPSAQLAHWGTPKARIRGHKLYWRKLISGIDAVRETDAVGKEGKQDTQHTSMRPIKPNVQFTFRVYFENLSSAELGALAWALTLGGDPQARHMLGMGKPYGMGVARLESALHLCDRVQRYATLFDDTGDWESGYGDAPADTQPFVDAFKQMIADKTGRAFDQHERIRQLKVMLREVRPDPRFDYMTIEPNEFKDRPVLPYPTDVVRGT
ncbi:MAG: TIGR03986 family CRISPR-associated RAMP protein [Anaerolineae bacterium]|nr:TIGR03986 family CRISPR-associated RAMP protein [Anaerolineae bacterium]